MTAASNLSRALGSYFKHKGNRLVFTNGQTLNQLAIEMWGYLGFHGVDSSILSKVITGKRLFTYEQLYAFCKILRINEVDKYSLENALGKDLLAKHVGVVVPISDIDELVADSYLKNLILCEIKKLREKGNLHEAMEIICFFEKILNFTPKIKKTNISLMAKILNEKVRCLIFTEKSENFIQKVKNINNLALQIAKETKEPDIISMSQGNIGGSYYVAGRLKDSAEYLEKTFFNVDEDTQIEYLRTLLNDYAFLGDQYQYKKTYLRTERILNRQNTYNNSHIASIYEAMARSSALIGNIGHARKLLQRINTSKLESFYQSEIIRGKIFVCYQEFLKNKTTDIDEVKHLLNKSSKNKLLLFKRHQAQIKSMSQKIYASKISNAN